MLTTKPYLLSSILFSFFLLTIVYFDFFIPCMFPCRPFTEPCMFTCRRYREPFRLSREPCMLSTKLYLLSFFPFYLLSSISLVLIFVPCMVPCRLSREPCMLSTESYTLTKEPSFHKKSPDLYLKCPVFCQTNPYLLTAKDQAFASVNLKTLFYPRAMQFFRKTLNSIWNAFYYTKWDLYCIQRVVSIFALNCRIVLNEYSYIYIYTDIHI